MTTTRREFLTAVGVAGATAAFGFPTGALALSGSSIQCRPYRVLYINLLGGLSHRDTTWREQAPDEAANGGPNTWAPWREEPDMASVHPLASLAAPIDFLNTGDYRLTLGAGFFPLQPVGALDRTRLVVLEHRLAQHTIASALTMTGVEQGRPGFASLGARFQARFPATSLPSAWVVDAHRVGRFTEFATATGDLGLSNRPLLLPVTREGIVSHLERSELQHTDALSRFYRDRYDRRLTHASGRVRAAAFDLYSDTMNRMFDWKLLHDFLHGAPSLNFDEVGNVLDNPMSRGIRLAGYLLREGGARFVQVIGGENAHPGLDTHGLGPFDEHATRHNAVVWGVSFTLASMIASGELDLDDTMVVLASEFGRYARNDFEVNDGTDHDPTYPAVLIGGPIKERGVAGHIGFSGNGQSRGEAEGHFTVTELAAAVCLAGGIDPVQEKMFELGGDGSEAGKIRGDSREEAEHHLIVNLLGTEDGPCPPHPDLPEQGDLPEPDQG